MPYKWLDWAKRIQSISQAGISFSTDVYDQERFQELQAISADIMAHYGHASFEYVHDLFQAEVGYMTPKLDVRGVIFREEKILLVKETHDQLWALPGGFCEIGISPKENIIKEVREETGFNVIPSQLLALFDSHKHPHPPQRHHYYKVFMLCSIIGGEMTTGIETKDVQFFRKEDLPLLSTRRNTLSQVEQMFAFLHDPKQPPFVD